MQACLRQPARLSFQRQQNTRTNIERVISMALKSNSTSVRTQGCRFKSTLWSDQGIQAEKLLNHNRSANFTPEEAPAPKENIPPSSHLKNSGKVPPPGVKTLKPPTNALPEKPSKPSYPCPHLSNEEVATYLFPLYERGWGIFTRAPVRTNEGAGPPSLMLARDISFVWHFPLVDFLTTLNVLVKQENHHPRIAYEFRTLELRMQTHEATLEDPQEQGQDQPKSGSSPQITPGITLRDIRLAYLIEAALQPYYELNKLVEPTILPFQTPNSIRELGLMMKTYPATEAQKSAATTRHRPTNCIVCGGDHWATQCPKRFTVQPMVPCDLCGGSHWRFTCLLYKDWKAKVRKNKGKTQSVQEFGES